MRHGSISDKPCTIVQTLPLLLLYWRFCIFTVAIFAVQSYPWISHLSMFYLKLFNRFITTIKLTRMSPLFLSPCGERDWSAIHIEAQASDAFLIFCEQGVLGIDGCNESIVFELMWLKPTTAVVTGCHLWWRNRQHWLHIVSSISDWLTSFWPTTDGKTSYWKQSCYLKSYWSDFDVVAGGQAFTFSAALLLRTYVKSTSIARKVR